jgi:hypothetical protein
MNDITHPLQDGNPVEETPDAPITAEQIDIPQEQKSDMPPATLIIIQKLAPKFPNIDPNLITCIVQEMMADMQGMEDGSKCAMSPAILAGRYSMQEIVESGLGLDYKEFKADMGRVYGDYSGVDNLAATEFAIQSTFRNKYGLNIVLADLAASDDTETYWRTKLAAAVAKIEKNYLEIGDEVMITSANCNFGKIGTLMQLDSEKAEVLDDGIANSPLIIDEPFNNLKLLSASEKQAMRHIGALTVRVGHGDNYPEGISQAAITAWYQAVGQSVYAKLDNLEPVTMHRVAGAHLSCVHTSYTKDINNDVNVDNLLSVYANIPDFTKVAAMKIVPTSKQLDVTARNLVSDLIDELVTDRSIEDIQVRFSGSNGYYVLATYNKSDRAANLQARLARVVRTYLQDSPRPNLVMGSTAEANKVAIITDVRTVPAAYAVDYTTGLVCVPLDPMKLSTFDVRQATITHLSEVHGLNIAA